MCAECARFARSMDQPGLHCRLDVFEPSESDDKDREKVKLTLRTSASMLQQIFILGCATELGKTIKIYNHIEAPLPSLLRSSQCRQYGGPARTI
jgi:hypothetical protein